MKGGVRKGAGRKPKDASRDFQLRVCVTETEYRRLQVMADRWDVPVATAAYGLLADQLARVARRASDFSGDALTLAASRILAEEASRPDERLQADNREGEEEVRVSTPQDQTR